MPLHNGEIQLAELLCDSLDEGELRRYARTLDPALAHGLPGSEASRRAVADAISAAVIRRGDRRAAVRLLVRERPGRRQEIAAVAAVLGVPMSGSPASEAPGPEGTARWRPARWVLVMISTALVATAIGLARSPEDAEWTVQREGPAWSVIQADGRPVPGARLALLGAADATGSRPRVGRARVDAPGSGQARLCSSFDRGALPDVLAARAWGEADGAWSEVACASVAPEGRIAGASADTKGCTWTVSLGSLNGVATGTLVGTISAAGAVERLGVVTVLRADASEAEVIGDGSACEPGRDVRVVSCDEALAVVGRHVVPTSDALAGLAAEPFARLALDAGCGIDRAAVGGVLARGAAAYRSVDCSDAVRLQALADRLSGTSTPVPCP